MNAVVKFEMRVRTHVKRDGELFVAECPDLDVVSQGNSEAAALENLTEALQLFVETCYEMGTLGEVLREQGFHPGAADNDEDEEPGWVSVPLSLVSGHAQACAA